jgi:hypothetical protein
MKSVVHKKIITATMDFSVKEHISIYFRVGGLTESFRFSLQKDIVTPTVFNVVVDAIVHAWYHQLDSEGLSDIVRAIFYDDNGHLYSNEADTLQRALEIIVEIFERMVLKSNPTKTKAMVCTPHPSITRICTPAYKCRMGDSSTS